MSSKIIHTVRWLITGPRPAIVAALLLIFAFSFETLFASVGREDVWRFFGVPALTPSFADMRTVTHSLECVRQGVNPYIVTTCDPWDRVFNYPRAWLWLAPLGIGADQTNLAGWAQAALVYFCFALLFRPQTLTTGVLTLLAILAPVILLGIERGNIDLFLFSLLVLGFAVTARAPGIIRNIGRGILIAALTVLKIFPIAAVIALVHKRGGILPAVAFAVASGILFYLSLASGDLAMIGRNTPQGTDLSFGSTPLLFALLQPESLQITLQIRMLAGGIAISIGIICTALIALRGPKAVPSLPRLEAGNLRDDVALACLCIFVFSFLLGSNWDYRLVFLSAVLPPLIRQYDDTRRFAGLLLIVGAVAFLWLSRIGHHLFWLDEMLGWTAFVVASLWLARTMLERAGPARWSMSAPNSQTQYSAPTEC